MSCPEPPICNFDVDVVEFEGDPDIAGPGVLLGFLIPAVVIYFVACFVFVYVDVRSVQKRLNRLDRLVIDCLRVERFRRLGSPALRRSVEDVAIMLSDQQLIVSTSILVVSFYQHCTITQYHFYISYTLALTSLSTLQLTTTLAQDRYLENSFMKHWRVCWIVSEAVIVVVAGVVTADDIWIYGQPVQCVWLDLGWTWGRPAFTAQSILTIIIIVLIEIWNILDVLHATYHFGWIGEVGTVISRAFRLPACLYCANQWIIYFVNKWLIKARNNAYESLLSRSPSLTVLFTFQFLANWVLWFCFWTLSIAAWILGVLGVSFSELLNTNLLNYLRSFGIILNGINQILDVKRNAKDEGLVDDEMEWGFGQVLPLMLLALPFTAILETYMKETEEARKVNKEESKASIVSSISESIDCSDPLETQPCAPSMKTGGHLDESSSIAQTDRIAASTVVAEGSNTTMPQAIFKPVPRFDTEEMFPSQPDWRSGGRGYNFGEKRQMWWHPILEEEIKFEDLLYEYKAFKVWLILLVGGSFVGIIIGVLYGWSL